MTTTYTRLRDWQSRLQACIAARRRLAFAWGEHDCCLFAADCVQAMTGADPAAAYRGRYDSELGAARLLKAAGGVRGLLTEAFGEPINVRLARVGDVGIATIAERDHVAVCGGAMWLTTSFSGVVAALQPHMIADAWRVG